MSKFRRGHIEWNFHFKINVLSQKPECLIHYPPPPTHTQSGYPLRKRSEGNSTVEYLDLQWRREAENGQRIKRRLGKCKPVHDREG